MVDRKIAVIGLGYVGLPLALAFARKFKQVVGFDINSGKVAKLKQGIDVTDEGLEELIKASSLKITDQASAMRGSDFFVVGVPTPIDQNNTPDLQPLVSACELVGPQLTPGSIVVFESTVYPGLTEEVCAPLLEKHSGLKWGKDFFLGYSPERINPGDKEHTLEKITKVVSGENAEILQIVSEVYGAIIEAGIHQAPSIKVAEAAKVIENTQRDLNIALMNELSIIFNLIGIRTADVLEAAGTKWNFLKFNPGLVGGHCIGVDPYYLTTKAEQLGYRPQVILAGRRINDGMGKHVAQQLVKTLIVNDRACKGARVGILGLTFKENVTDLRNSRVPDIIKELQEYGIAPMIHDPSANAEQAHEEYGVHLTALEDFKKLDALILAVTHKEYLAMGLPKLMSMLVEGGVFADLKSAYSKEKLPSNIVYWSL